MPRDEPASAAAAELVSRCCTGANPHPPLLRRPLTYLTDWCVPWTGWKLTQRKREKERGDHGASAAVCRIFQSALINTADSDCRLCLCVTVGPLCSSSISISSRGDNKDRPKGERGLSSEMRHLHVANLSIYLSVQCGRCLTLFSIGYSHYRHWTRWGMVKAVAAVAAFWYSVRPVAFMWAIDYWRCRLFCRCCC